MHLMKQFRSIILLLCGVLLLSFTVGCQNAGGDRPIAGVLTGTDVSGSQVSETDGFQANPDGAASDKTDSDANASNETDCEGAPSTETLSPEAPLPETPSTEALSTEAPSPETPSTQTPSTEPHTPVETKPAGTTSKETEAKDTEPEETTPVTDAPDDTQTNNGVEDGNGDEDETDEDGSEDGNGDEDAVSNAELLVGTWSTVKRFDYGADGAALLVYTICFKADGTGVMNDLEYTYYADVPDGDWGDGWSLAGRGYVPWYFTYTLEGDELTRTTIPVEEWDEPGISYDPVSFSERDKLTLNGMTYLRGEYDLKTLCTLLNVDYTVVIPTE